jgi:hypothetical protein
LDIGTPRSEWHPFGKVASLSWAEAPELRQDVATVRVGSNMVFGGGVPAHHPTQMTERLVRFAGSDDMGQVLEVWIDDARLPVTVRVLGVLSQSTGPMLLAIVDDLLLEGFATFMMDSAGLEIADASGAAALVVLQRRLREASATLLWRGAQFALRARTAIGHGSDDQTALGMADAG